MTLTEYEAKVTAVKLPTNREALLLSTQPINPLTELFAGLEVRYIFAIQFNNVAGFWITPDTRRTVVKTKTTETTNFHTLVVNHGVSHFLDNHLNSHFHVAGLQLILTFCDSLYQF